MTNPDTDRLIVVTRRIEAQRELVFDVYTETRHLDQWWGPDGFRITTHAFEFRPGGVWEFTMHGPDGTDYPNWIEWLEVSPPERIEFRHGSSADDPDMFQGSFTFADDAAAGSTEVTLRSLFPSKEARDRAVEEFHAVEGARQTLAHLDRYVGETRKRGSG